MARRGHAVRPRFIHFTGRLLCPGTQNATNGAISLQTDFEMPFPGASAPGTQNERDRDMTRFRSILAVLGLGLTAATVPPATSLALGPGFFDQVIAPAGLTCSFNAYHDSAAQETQLNLFIPNGASQSSGGNYWSGGVITSWPGGDITAAAIASECGATNVVVTLSDGANGTYATDDFVGVEFRATSLADGNTRDYVIGASGAGSTVLVNNSTMVANTPPTADAGPDRTVGSGAAVTLDGSGSDANDAGQSLGYAWSQSSGPAVTLSGATTATPGFTAPVLVAGAADAVLVFSLVVNDGSDPSPADTVAITVTAPGDSVAPVIAAPVPLRAEAGPDGTALVGFKATVTDNVDQAVTPVFTLDGAVITSPFAFPVGVSKVLIDATDAAGNSAVQQILVVTVTPAAAPPPPVITTAAINADRSLTIGGTAAADARVRVTFPDASFQEATATGGLFSVTSAANMTGGTVSVTAANAPGNSSAATTVELFPDYEAPTVALSGAPATLTDMSAFTVTITFSEPVVGFETGDVTVSGGTVTAFSGTGAVYRAGITPGAVAEVTIGVRAGVAEDLATNPNLAAAPLTVLPDTSRIAQEAITDALTARGRALIGAQPDLRGFLTGSAASGLEARASRGQGNFRIGAGGQDSTFWALAQGRWSDSVSTEMDYYHLALGAHLLRGKNLIVGAMLQFDSADAGLDAGSFEGRGWLAGPYLVARLPDQPLYLSASILHGRSDNTLTLAGQAPDDFSSTRTLLTAGVEGRFAWTETTTIIPSLDLSHLVDRQKRYVDSRGNTVGAQSIRLTEAAFGLGFEHLVRLDDNEMLLSGGISGIFSDQQAPGDTATSTRGRIDLGAEFRLGEASSLSLTTFYDGLGDTGYGARGAALDFEMRF